MPAIKLQICPSGYIGLKPRAPFVRDLRWAIRQNVSRRLNRQLPSQTLRARRQFRLTAVAPCVTDVPCLFSACR
jgi:hypothetical protein